MKKLVVTVVLLLIVVGVLAGIKAMQIGALMDMAANMPMRTETVSSVIAEEQEWRPVQKAVGSTLAVQGVTLSTEMGGLITQIAFESGTKVKKGDLLIELDSRSEQAQLRSAEAAYELAKINLVRTRELRGNEMIPQAELDSAEAKAKEAEAQVENLKAIIDRKTLRAPFDGRLGLRQVNLGQYLNPGAPVVTLQSEDPIYVNFSLPQQQLSWVQVGLPVQVTVDTLPEPLQGTVTAIAAEVDQTNRNIRLQATLANPEGKLKPGMFVNVEVMKDSPRKVLVIPQTAVLYASYGNSVFVIEKAKEGDHLVATQHFVKLGEKRGDFVEVLDGIKSGDQIVSAGAFKLQNGMAVVINNEKPLKPEVNPTPRDS